MVHDNLDVNPDSVSDLAEPYQYAAGDFNDLSGQIDQMWSRYQNAWGHDSIGAQVAPAFEQGFAYLRASAKAFHETLNFYSDGLTRSGKVYGESETNAAEGGRQLDVAFSQIQPPTLRTPGEPARFEVAHRVEARLLPEEPGEKVFLRSEHRLAEPLTEGTLLEGREMSRLAPAIPAGAVIDPSIPPDDYGPWYRLPDGTILAHPARQAIAAERYEAVRPNMPTIPAGAVIDPSIPPDDYGPWYRLPDGTILAHPARQARTADERTDN
jgi:uncharacterized protein YukE